MAYHILEDLINLCRLLVSRIINLLRISKIVIFMSGRRMQLELPDVRYEFWVVIHDSLEVPIVRIFYDNRGDVGGQWGLRCLSNLAARVWDGRGD